MQKVVLVGYMGSGKSFIGQLLSEKLQILFLDLDEIIEQNQNCSIKSIFENRGEFYFRKLEHQLFKETLSLDKPFVLSTGGGTVCYANNHELLNNPDIVSIYLKASIETLYNRLILEKEKRPLIATKNQEELKDFIAKNLFERSYFYHLSEFVINVDDKTANEIIKEILELLA